MLKLLNGWKTILGLVLLAAVCVLHGGNLVKCVTDVLTTPEGQAGLAGGLTVVGLVHKVEKWTAKKPAA